MNRLTDIDFGEIRGRGPLGLENDPGQVNTRDSVGLLISVLTMVVGILTVVASIWFLFKLITGGIAILSSGGDKGKLANARSDITMGIVGLLVVILATIFIDFIGSLFGLDILNIRIPLMQRFGI